MNSDSGSLRERIGSLLDTDSDSPNSVSIVGNTYINRRLGLAFAYPRGWLFEDATSLLDTAEGRLWDPENDRVTEVMRELTEQHLPVVSVAAPLREDGIDRVGDVEFRPAVVVHCDSECEPVEAFSLQRHVEIDLEHFRALAPQFEILAKPKTREISGHPAVEYIATYPYYHEQVPDDILVRERALYVARCPTIFEVRMVDFPERDERLSFDFDPFVSSLWVA